MTTNLRRQIGRNSATRLPSWDWHSTMDGRMAKRMNALTPVMSSLHRLKFDELWFTNPGVYDGHLATILGAKWAKSKNRHISAKT